MSKFNILGRWDRYGLPQYLSKNTPCKQDLSYIKASFPEQIIPLNKLTFTHDTHLSIIKKTSACVTFISETGQNWHNSLGFYVINETNKTPHDLTIIFPNCSDVLNNTSGVLETGYRVNIGDFNPGDKLGFFLIQNGWNPRSGSVDEDQPIFYTHDVWNPNHQNHFMLIKDKLRKCFIYGVEDTYTYPDYNDLVFSVTFSDHDAVDTGNVKDIQEWLKLYTLPDHTLQNMVNGPDNKKLFEFYQVDNYNIPIVDPDCSSSSSSDSSSDTDEFISICPGENLDGILMFEDLWPTKGDYDHDDLTLRYNICEFIKDGMISKIVATFKILESEADFHNSFGICLDSIPDDATESITLEIANQTRTITPEPGHQELVIILTKDVHEFVGHTVNLTIEFKQPIDENLLDIPPYNSFIIINQNRDMEVHLPYYNPTGLVDQSYFQTQDDNSNPFNDVYYISKDDQPWAFCIPCPSEKNHAQFKAWAKRHADRYINWYENKYRKQDINLFDKLYSKYSS